jgi:hypothetical protein
MKKTPVFNQSKLNEFMLEQFEIVYNQGFSDGLDRGKELALEVFKTKSND